MKIRVLLSALYDSDGEPPHYQTRLHCGKGEFDVNRVDTTHRLENLRFQMRRVDAIHGPPIQAFIITSDDEHQSENVPEHDRRMEYITGFTGSQGEAVVTETKAALWIDGRYFLQADRELDCNWQLMRAGLPNVSNMTKWLKDTLKPGSRVGADARIIANYVWETWREELGNAFYNPSSSV
ncbi:hypothetical protein J437_LFUL007239 [Ladona fulva]|uniref:Creatinase N-terminal domain-containing protein n=1 Tax=Ladona fulva TaxID=123851 RepID=A0A8K0NYB5_LADFU|nr:hypothetical protein J437_LFUL007239 [Ladona fulva]